MISIQSIARGPQVEPEDPGVRWPDVDLNSYRRALLLQIEEVKAAYAEVEQGELGPLDTMVVERALCAGDADQREWLLDMLIEDLARDAETTAWPLKEGA